MRSVRLAVTSGYLRRARAPLVSLLSTSLRSFQTQEISPGEISLVEPSEGAANPSEAAVGGSTKIETSNEIPTYFNDTKHVDAFSRARVVNFIKRFSQGTVASGSEVFKGREVRNSDGSTLFHSCVRLPFRTETSEIWAHGLACNSKDAELLAAMHAEYIIDEFGYHIYTLPSMQRKHAEAARKAGRWAPMPDDIDRARSSVRIPPPLRRIVDSDETENGKWLLIDMQPNHYISPSHTLLSPCLLDTTSAHRIKALFDEHKLSFAELCTSQAEEAVESSGQTWYVATIIIPIELTTFSEIKAQGKALNREAAITLACMHAELVLDAHYICLYPHDSIMQKQHALAAWSYGRPAPLPGECQKNPLHVASPLPLKQLASRREDRVSCMSYEEDLVVRHRALTRQTCEFTDTPVLEHKAVGQIKQFLKEQNVARTDPFFVEEVSGYYKATVVLPIPDLFGIRGGVGIAINAPDACTLAAMHAIDVLNSLGLGISLDGTAVQRCGGEPVSSDTQDPGQLSPPGRRKLGALSSPTVVGGSNEGSVSQTAETSGSQTRRRRVTKRAHITTAEAEGLTNDGRKDEMQKETDVGDYLKARETVSKELWSLEADSPDGYIMVSPEDPDTRTQYEHALHSPRQIDPTSKSRIRGYLASMGRRLDDVFVVQRIDAEDNGGQPICRCAINLPVPRRFGDRIALGEAVDPKDAESLASMHAELILDTLGIPVYVDGALQRDRARLSAKCGRYAPMEYTESVPPSTQSPPPLRREVVGSIHWENRHKKRRASIVVQRVERKDDKEPTAVANEDFQPLVAPKDKQNYLSVQEKDLDLVSRARVSYYLRRNGVTKLEAEFRMELRGLGNVQHIAEMVLPVPEKYGKRVAHGSALTKRDAEVLCWMHAEQIIDAIGLCLFDNLPVLQKRHVQRVQRLGRWAPLTDENGQKPSDTPTPLPLILGTTQDKPPHPTPPVDLVRDWAQYIQECQRFVEINQMREDNIFFEMGKSPRTGDVIYDAALDEAETGPVDNEAKITLQRYCNLAGLQYPVYWKSRTVGPTAYRMCLTTVEVPGHEYLTASGVAANKEASQRRAAMHIFALLRRIEPDFAELERKAKTENAEKVDLLGSFSALEDAPAIRRSSRAKKDVGNWDPVTKDFSHEGKVRIIGLFTVCFGLEPPLVRHLNRREGSLVHHTTTVEVKDEDGKLWTGSASDAGPRFNEPAAYDNLFSKLSRGLPGFQALMDLIRTHQHLDPEHIANVSLSKEQRERMYKALDGLPDVEEEGVAQPQQWLDTESEVGGLMSLIAMDASRREQLSQELVVKLREKLVSEEYRAKYAMQRERLRIYDKRDEILEAVGSNQIVIICGTTGCGKTTQVPQYILDHMTEKGRGGDCSIVITQPRRLSAVSIAQRVAAERLENIGETCGYTIRLDTRPGRCINFCTSGVLLRLLHSAPLLTGINYLIIDEIHERDINSDFLLILLRQLLRRRRDLRVILMSATLQAEQFGKYFGDAPIINVEGYMHAVQELYVEDLVPLAMEHNLLTPLLKEAAATLDLENENSARGYSAPVPITTSKYGFLEATAEIDYMAIQFAIEHAVRSLDLTDSSVLVFLPGWDEIIKAKEILERNTKYYILSLHSSVGPEEQMQCFLPAPEGKVKIILSTNIAESGVTIDDVAVVIDVGRGKEKSYVMEKGMTSIGRNEMGSMSQLVTVYASRANCVQRRGRVGRTRPGMCIRLYSRRHFQSLHDFQTPEMLRTHLDALCLQILALDLGDPADFLQQALEPPSSENIEAAMKRLNELGATTYTRQLTPLGLRLSRLPLAPKVGKMVIMGAILRCLDSALTIASVTDGDVFISAREHREAVRLHKEDLSHGTQSDVIASVNAFNFWVTAHYEKPPAEVVYDLQERLLSVPQLLTVSKYKRQFFDIIMNSGFISVPDDKKKMHDRSRADIFVDKSDYSVDALNVGLVKCVVAAGMFPNVVMSRGRRLMRNKLANHLVPCSGSVVYRTARHDIAQPYFVYDELAKSTETDRLQVRNLSNVSLWTILLMGTSSMPVTYRDDLNLAVVDEWIMFRASFGTLELIRKFKRALNICLSRKFMNPENAENNARLEEFRCIIKELVCTPFKPNDLVEKQWVEKGVILEPRTRARGGSAAYVETEGDTNSSMGLEAPVVSETVGTSVSE
ncbi:Double stranded RNA binding motifDEAD DEAH box helicase Helicase conserved C terminal domain [Trypanosoma vivax]|nr:Double stranded RNA binding motifDEAD DEAH box helicase Helicase conserved C terminal domain [Trypanosoma vivax]